jgi:Cap4 SAVED domain
MIDLLPNVAAGDLLSVPAHLSCLIKCATSLSTSDGQAIEVWELRVDLLDPHLSTWASTFRQQYCADEDIDNLRAGTGLSRAEYLTNLVFPDEESAPGPSIRAGDFAELLVADFVEHLLGYWVPRGKYAEKAVRNESVKGVDILGFHLATPASASSDDVLLTFEAKAQLSAGTYVDRLQVAINDSSKDSIRRAETLNATKRRLHSIGDSGGAQTVERFQNPTDHPYVYRSGAAAVLSDSVFNEELLKSNTSVAGHKNASDLLLVVIRGTELMKLVHLLYRKAADEA